MKTGGRKRNVGTYEQIMVDVMEMILYKKLSYTEFKKEASLKFGVSQRQAESYYRDARNRLKERFSQDREEILQEQLARYFSLLDRAKKDDNRRIEAEVLRDLNKIFGLDQPVKVDLTSGGAPLNININILKD